MFCAEQNSFPLHKQISSEIELANFSISDTEMRSICSLIKNYSGITLNHRDKHLVISRLTKRIRLHRLKSFHEYISLLDSRKGYEERSAFVEALTTNETYFFREKEHFNFLSSEAIPQLQQHTGMIRAWSAAASQGQEAYSIAMSLASSLGYIPWEVFGSDINQEVLAMAKEGVYPLERLNFMPGHLLKKYCLRGNGPMKGYLAITPELRQRVKFDTFNLNKPLPTDFQKFDIIFLRNVLIYFDKSTQEAIINNVLSALKPKGYFFIGTSEHIEPKHFGLIQVKKSIFRLKDA